MKRTILALLLLCCANLATAQERDRKFEIVGWTLAGAATADFISKQHLLARGGAEANPLAPSDAWKQAAFKAGFTGLTLWGTNWMHHHGYKRFAFAVRIAYTVALSFIATRNFTLEVGF